MERQLIHKEDVVKCVENRDFDVLILLGAGDIEDYVPQIIQALS